MPNVISRFAGRYRFLSNFYRVPITWEGIAFPSAEHAFNAGKTFDGAARLRIAEAPTSADAKQMGRAVQPRPDWDARVRYEVMVQVLGLKFESPLLRHLLLDTGDALLVEGNDWHDAHWGVCFCSRHRGAGDNHLGRLLMEERDRLRRGR